MHRTLIALIPLMTSACLVIRDVDPERRDQPVEEAPCASGGADPGDDEVFGDDVDSDCDGDADVEVVVVEAPARTTPLDWGVGADLRRVGGPTLTGTGRLVGQELVFSADLDRGITSKWSTDYGPAPEDAAGLRLEDQDGRLDLIHTDGVLSAYRPGPAHAEPAWTVDLPTHGPLDAAITADGVWAVTCDGTTVEALRYTAVGLVRHTLPREADTCAVLGGTGNTMAVLVGDDLPLERWKLDAEDGFVDRARLTRSTGMDHVRTASGTQDAVLAIHDEGDLYVFARDGDGLFLGDGEATSLFDVAVDDAGTALVTWVDTGGTVWAAVGAPQTLPTVRPVLRGVAPDRLAAGLTEDGLVIAVQQDARVTLLRARR